MGAFIRSRIAVLMLLFFMGFMLSAENSKAQTRSYHYEYSDSLSQGENVANLGDAIFGENVSYVEGAINFSVTDVNVKTRAKLPLTFGRKLEFRDDMSDANTREEFYKFLLLGNWGYPEVPVMRGYYPDNDGFLTGARTRCSSGSVAATAIPYPGGPPIFAFNFWYGFRVSIPGYGSGNVEKLTPEIILPTDGASYKLATLDGWRISCLGSIKNGAGEGFVVLLPDGAKYYFDWMVKRRVKDLSTPYAPIKRYEVFMFATKAVDRFGNSIVYEYDQTNQMRINKIEASDGASILINYNQNGWISSVTAGSQVWQYSYTTNPDNGYPTLREVVLPDQSRWKYENPTYAYGDLSPDLSPFGQDCNYDPGRDTSSGDGAVSVHRMTHPSGAIGEFYYKAIAHGYNNVPMPLCNSDGLHPLIGRPKAVLRGSMISKKIYGPGVAPMEWKFTYAPSWSFEWECANGCPNTSTTTVTSSLGKTETYVFGNDFKSNANQLLSYTVSQEGRVLKRAVNTYLSSASSQPFPDYVVGYIGDNVSETLDNPFFRKNRPLVKQEIYQDGVIFTRHIDEFDRFVRPVRSTLSSALTP
ncbi:MAG TPA: hypothetical protein VF471_07940 [Pseudoxanthomonas sp.]